MNEYNLGLQALVPSQGQRHSNIGPFDPDDDLIYVLEFLTFFVLAVIGALMVIPWLLTVSVGMLLYVAKYRRR